MKVFGLDFTSAPSRKKPITQAHCAFEKGTVSVLEIKCLTDFDQFEAFLNSEGEWIAGIDFPFGQPRKFVTNLGWPEAWASYVGKVAAMSKEEFETLLRQYKACRAKGDKEHLRETDKLADARSPMKLVRPPVAKMFFRGAPRLLHSRVCVLPFDVPHEGEAIVLEASPALVARKFLGRRSYKGEGKKKLDTERKAAREEIVQGIRSGELRDHYGFGVEITESLTQELVLDPTGDQLDALLCAI